MSTTWIRRWRKLPARDRSLLREALLDLWIVRLALPVRALSALTREAAGADRPVDVGKVAWAVKTAARAVPGAACLAQAVAAQRMLAARGKPSKLEVGVAKDPRGLQAHAWLVCEGEIVIGGEAAGKFVPLESP